MISWFRPGNPPKYVERDIMRRSLRQGQQCGEVFPHLSQSAQTGALFTRVASERASWSEMPINQIIEDSLGFQ